MDPRTNDYYVTITCNFCPKFQTCKLCNKQTRTCLKFQTKLTSFCQITAIYFGVHFLSRHSVQLFPNSINNILIEKYISQSLAHGHNIHTVPYLQHQHYMNCVILTARQPMKNSVPIHFTYAGISVGLEHYQNLKVTLTKRITWVNRSSQIIT